MWRHIQTFWDREESLTVFLGLLILFTFVIAPISHVNPRFHIIVAVFFAFLLLAGLWATLESPKLALITAALVMVSITTSIAADVLSSSGNVRIISAAADVPPFALLLFIVLKQTMKEGPITAHRVKGAVSSYLLIGLLCAKLYVVFFLVMPNSFSGVQPEEPVASLVYFSFVTLTTLGYGDILPLHELTRALANAEGLIGQLFPAIFIARLVSLQLEHRHSQ